MNKVALLSCFLYKVHAPHTDSVEMRIRSDAKITETTAKRHPIKDVSWGGYHHGHLR